MSVKEKIVITAALLVAVGLIVVAYWLRTDDDSDLAVTSNDALEEIIPQRASEILRQDQVGIDLTPGYSGRLNINGVPIPEEDTDVTEALNLVVFRPGPDKVFESLEPGENCVLATYWETRLGDGESETINWCFEVT
jgi:hypothetical protein